ncbi:hypothetical protein F5Y15DRAFT_426856 [Xylariaceae sp. FL0016]|nr:hypothetical protein F5Y15DRAFT_426856 [Xylariaceae sp. FL0016]
MTDFIANIPLLTAPEAMDRIPVEVLLLIYDFLDGPAPSERRLHDQPSHDMLQAPSDALCPLKGASLVSKSWRTLLLPILFRHVQWKPKVSSLRAFTLNPIPLLRFLVENRIARDVVTFTLVITFYDQAAVDSQQTSEIRPADLEWLWDQLFSVLDPLRFTVIARPTTLAALLSRMLFLDEAWAFDVPYHILSLARSTREPQSPAAEGERAGVPETEPHLPGSADESAGDPPPPAEPSTPERHWRRRRPASLAVRPRKPPPCPLFTARPWTSLLLNEGSSTKVYRVYEFFLRRPPSMLGALLGCEEHPNDAPLLPASVVDLSYVAIFPLSSHVETLLRHLPPRLRRLFVRLTPGPGCGILGDARAMRHIDPADLWMERDTAYGFLMRELASPVGNWAALRVFESGDASDREAWDMVVQTLEDSGTNAWRVEREGVLVRRADGEEETPL